MPILDSLLPYLKLSNRDDYNGINAESTQEEVKTAAASSTLSPAQHNTVCSLILRMIADASPSEGHALLSKYVIVCFLYKN